MRVHHIINSYSLHSGGAERLVRRLHLGLRMRGVESFVLGLMAHQDSRLDYARSLDAAKPYMWKTFWGFLNYCRENVQPGDILHVHLSPCIFYAAVFKVFFRRSIHLVMTEHNTHNRRRGTFRGYLLDQFIYRSMDKIVCISRGTQQSLTDWVEVTRRKTTVIYNGVPFRFQDFIPRAVSPSIRIVSVGRISEQKNYTTALEALALLNDVDFEYWIAGGGDRGPLAAQMHRLGLEGKVRFLGHIDWIADFLKQADVFLMPSIWEGFGLAAVEAMNASLPLIVSDVDGLREVVGEEPPCAILVDPKSPESIADTLRKFVHMPQDQREQLGKVNFERAKQFSEEMMVDAHESFYTTLLN